MSPVAGTKHRRLAVLAAAVTGALALLAVIWFVAVPLWEEDQTAGTGTAPGTESSSAPTSTCQNPYFWSGALNEVPTYDPDSEDYSQVDLRSYDLSQLDLRGRAYDLLHADFDSQTKWPDKLPGLFDPDRIMELGKNPGLDVRTLHAAGITGEGIGVAIIDQTLLTDHEEYVDRLKLYEEMPNAWPDVQMHGPGVSSIAVGKTVGVAPGADLYFINACASDASSIAPAIDRIIEVNRSLPADRKIQVLSMSFTYDLGGTDSLHRDDILQAAQRARDAGILVLSCEPDDMPYKFYGLGRDPLADPEKLTSYGPSESWAEALRRGAPAGSEVLLVPMDSRCTASPTGNSDYVFYRQGGMSWTTPYLAGLYALACQVRPDVAPEVFWSAGLETGHLLKATRTDGTEITLGRIVDPVALIEKLAGRDIVPEPSG